MALRYRMSEQEIEAVARAWWEALRAATGTGVPWEGASEEARQATRDYVKEPR